jgi:methyl-accepting chemotaxis protein
VKRLFKPLLRPSVRTTLGGLFISLSLMLVAASIDALRHAQAHYVGASRIAEMTSAGQAIAQTLAARNRERLLLQSAFSAEAPISVAEAAKLNEFRSNTDRVYQDMLARLNALSLSNAAPVLKGIQDAYSAWRAPQETVDAALHLPKAQRDAAFWTKFSELHSRVREQLYAGFYFLDAIKQNDDLELNDIFRVNIATAAARSSFYLWLTFIENATINGIHLSNGEILAAAEARGAALRDWSALGDAARAPTLPAPVQAAFAAAEQAHDVFFNGAGKSLWQTLVVGHVPNVSYSTVRDQLAPPVNALIALNQAAMEAANLRTNQLIQWANQERLVYGAVLLAVVVVGFAGVAIIDLRISRPIRAMAITMNWLSDYETTPRIPGLGRRDEIGDMAAAVKMFHDELIHADMLAIDNEKYQASEKRAHAEAAAEIAAMSTRQGEVVEALAFGLSQLADGQVGFSLEIELAPEYEMLRTFFNDALRGLAATVRQIIEHGQTITTGTGKLASAAEDLAHRTKEQATSLEQTAATLDAITATVRQTAAASQKAQSMAAKAKSDVAASEDVMRETTAAMSAIESSARQIGQIISVIDEISFQTNLLALNAGVEAARAGDAGRGFAVVASEVRALAQRAADAAKEIKTLVSGSMKQVERGVRLIGETGQALGRIQLGVSAMSGSIIEIAASAAEQSSGLAGVNAAVSQMDRVTQENAAMVENSTLETRALAQAMAELNEAVARFKLEEPRLAA